jgi:hypothetical protein
MAPWAEAGERVPAVMANTTNEPSIEAPTGSRKAKAPVPSSWQKPRGAARAAAAKGLREARTGCKKAFEVNGTKPLLRAHASHRRFHEAGLLAKVRLTDLVPAD